MSQTPNPNRCAACAGTGKLPNGKLTDFVICDVCDGSGVKEGAVD
jgi:hypothetical protein